MVNWPVFFFKVSYPIQCPEIKALRAAFELQEEGSSVFQVRVSLKSVTTYLKDIL